MKRKNHEIIISSSKSRFVQPSGANKDAVGFNPSGGNSQKLLASKEAHIFIILIN